MYSKGNKRATHHYITATVTRAAGCTHIHTWMAENECRQVDLTHSTPRGRDPVTLWRSVNSRETFSERFFLAAIFKKNRDGVKCQVDTWRWRDQTRPIHIHTMHTAQRSLKSVNATNCSFIGNINVYLI